MGTTDEDERKNNPTSPRSPPTNRRFYANAPQVDNRRDNPFSPREKVAAYSPTVEGSQRRDWSNDPNAFVSPRTTEKLASRYVLGHNPESILTRRVFLGRRKIARRRLTPAERASEGIAA